MLFFLCLAQRSPFLKLDRKAALVCTLRHLCFLTQTTQTVFLPSNPSSPHFCSLTEQLLSILEGPSLWDSLSFSSLFSVSHFLSLLWVSLPLRIKIPVGREGQGRNTPKAGRWGGGEEPERIGSRQQQQLVGSVHCSVCQCWSHL